MITFVAMNTLAYYMGIFMDNKGIKQEVKKQIEKITDTVDMDSINKVIKNDKVLLDFGLSKKTLLNISKWALDGKSQFEIQQNLELNEKEWQYLCHVCPAIILVMQHSMAYADIVVAGTLYQTAVGGQKIKKKVPLKIHDYNDQGKVIGEHYEMVEVETITEPNPYLLKYLAEHKMSENLGNGKRAASDEHRKIIDSMTDDEREAIAEYGNGKI